MKPGPISTADAANLAAVLGQFVKDSPDETLLAYPAEITRAQVTARTLTANAAASQKRKERRSSAPTQPKT